ncbi:MAG TPA: cupin domain-containing protein [Candidatus Dormibacteraeota bacterium]|nr:cupin domain-containing protein [Candidatus Dormibacteraeota bacterium]
MTTELLREPGQGRTFTVGTSRVVVKVQDGEPAAAFSLIEWSIPPGAPAPPRHIHHEGSETFFVLEGELTFPLAESRVVVVAGGCLHLPPGTPHTLANEGAVMARALEMFVPGSLMGLVEDVGALFASGMPPDRARLLEVFTRHASELVG